MNVYVSVHLPLAYKCIYLNVPRECDLIRSRPRICVVNVCVRCARHARAFGAHTSTLLREKDHIECAAVAWWFGIFDSRAQNVYTIKYWIISGCSAGTLRGLTHLTPHSCALTRCFWWGAFKKWPIVLLIDYDTHRVCKWVRAMSRCLCVRGWIFWAQSESAISPETVRKKRHTTNRTSWLANPTRSICAAPPHATNSNPCRSVGVRNGRNRGARTRTCVARATAHKWQRRSRKTRCA